MATKANNEEQIIEQEEKKEKTKKQSIPHENLNKECNNVPYKEITKEEAKKHSIDMLNKVGISMPEHVYDSYPHELSGGMRQRVTVSYTHLTLPTICSV